VDRERLRSLFDTTDRALAKARGIAAHSPLAVWMTKETMWQTVDSPSLRHALDLENRTQIPCTATGELMAAFAAFREGSARAAWVGPERHSMGARLPGAWRAMMKPRGSITAKSSAMSA
jgi:hypothetical protein